MIVQTLAVFRRELIDNLRDRGAVVMVMLFIGMVPVLLAGLFTTLAEREHSLATPPPVGVEDRSGGAADLLRHLHTDGYDRASFDGDLAIAVRSGAVQLGLRIDESFADDLAAGRPAKIELLADDSRHRAEADQLAAVLHEYAGEIASLRLIARGVAPAIVRPLDVQRVDHSTATGRAAQLLGTLVLFLVLAPFVASMGIATDAMAGERERRSLDLLLIQPVAPSRIVAGKWLAASVFAVVGIAVMLALSAWVLPRADLSALGVQVSLPPAVLGALLLSLAPLALLVAALQLSLSLLAKNFKEAQFYMTVLMFAAMAMGFFLEFREASIPAWTAWIPVAAQQGHVAGLVRGDALPFAEWAIVSALTLVATALVLRATAARLARSIV